MWGVAAQGTIDEELKSSRESDAETGFFEMSENSDEPRQSSAEMSSDKNPDARGLSSDLRSVVSATGPVPVKLETGMAGSSADGSQKDVISALQAPPDVLLLYWTLVWDGVLPKGYELEFASLESAIRKGAARALKRAAGSDNQAAAVWLHQRQRSRLQQLWSSCLLRATSLEVQGKVAGNFSMAPLQERKALRTKWIRELELLQGTATPMARILEERKGDCNVLGGGRRASTLRARVRAAKKYLSWLNCLGGSRLSDTG